MAEVTTEMLIDELLKLHSRLEALIAAKDETIAGFRETRQLVEAERKLFQEHMLTDELRRLRRDAAE